MHVALAMNMVQACHNLGDNTFELFERRRHLFMPGQFHESYPEVQDKVMGCLITFAFLNDLTNRHNIRVVKTFHHLYFRILLDLHWVRADIFLTDVRLQLLYRKESRILSTSSGFGTLRHLLRCFYVSLIHILVGRFYLVRGLLR